MNPNLSRKEKAALYAITTILFCLAAIPAAAIAVIKEVISLWRAIRSRIALEIIKDA